MLEATYPNPDKLLRPGQYGRVRVAEDVRKNAILVPQRAVKELQATFSVAVLGEGDKISMRTVKPGDRIGSLWVIESGLAAGETIVVEGMQKVREGVVVKPTVVAIEDKPAAAPAAAPAASSAAAAPATKPAAPAGSPAPAAGQAAKE
jgi:membrane fusion protein (multidrug efflux system)